MYYNMSFSREILSVLLKVLAVILTLTLIFIGLIVINFLSNTTANDNCNIAVMPIEGEIMPTGHGAEYPDFAVTPADVRDFIDGIHTDGTGKIEGVLFEINSPGGAPVAAETIAKQIKTLDLPNAALIGDIGASGGYMIASGANRIFASSMSEIGSIGATMSYVENSEKNKTDGLTYVSLTTGKFKDAGSPEKPLSPEDRTYFEGQLKIVYSEFIKLVAGNRNIPEDDVRAIADGSTLIGQQAVDKKLIDEIGDRDSIRAYFAEKLHKKVSDISFCEYKKPTSAL
jgi:protease-4